MIFNRKEIILNALQKALSLRKKMGFKLWVPLCIFDFVRKFDIDVRFLAIASLEGIYSSDPATIIISSLRPSGRQRFTCAHELGHHIYKHGTKIDEIYKDNMPSTNKQEFIADCFAGFLLMSQLSIQKAFKIRNWDYCNPTPLQIYVISHYFGIGYSTLINHMHWSLHLFSYDKAAKLLKISPKQIKQKLLNDFCPTDLIIVDRYWTDRAIDLSVDDFIITGKDIEIEGEAIEIVKLFEQKLIKAISPGISRLFNPKSDWASFVRVSKRKYEGLSDYRHFEEVE